MQRRSLKRLGLATHPLAALLAAGLAASAAWAQSADKPLGEILQSIEPAAAAEAAPPAPARSPPPTPAARPEAAVTQGIVPTALPPSEPADWPAAEETPTDEVPAEENAPSPPSEAELLQAEAEAAEQARIAELDRRRAARLEAARQSEEAALVEYQALLAARQAEIERAQADYQAALERNRLQAERDRAEWQERVRACEAGDRVRCFGASEKPR